MTQNDVMVIFDTKGDYLEEFYEAHRGDVVISNLGAEGKESAGEGRPIINVVWNVFLDINADGEKHWEENANEIARTIYDDIMKTSREGFFPRAATDITRSVMIALMRKAAKEGAPITNKELINFLRNSTSSEIHQLLSQHDDLKGASQYISLATSGQTQGVMSVIQSMVSDIFGGGFSEPGSFAIRDFVGKRSGRTLYIEYDLRWGRILTPIYKVLIDMAIKESLGRSSSGKGYVYFIIDEFALLPNLYHIDDGINFGRQQGARFLVGTQNVSQILESYGEGRGKSLLSNFGTVFAFRLNDEDSKQLVVSRYGKYRAKVSMKSPVPGDPLVPTVVEANVIEPFNVSVLPTGCSIICPSGKAPRLFQFSAYNFKQPRIEQAG